MSAGLILRWRRHFVEKDLLRYETIDTRLDRTEQWDT